MDLSNTTSALIRSLNIVMNPLSLPDERKAANEACENFKGSPSCIPCGLLLSAKKNEPHVRYFGLQLIEHMIKFKWNDLPAEEKCCLKNNVLEILSLGTFGHLEHYFIKDILSRLVVEIIKREWPQQWPDMLNELNTICSLGDTQTELVLLVFLRLAEDVAMLPCLPNRRRRDIQQVLMLHLKDLFAFFLKTLEGNFQKYLQLISSTKEEHKQQILVPISLVETVLKTLSNFVEWVPWCHITEGSHLLLQILCTLLVHDPFRLSAVDCLLVIADRKGKVEDRAPLLLLFSEDAMSVIFSAASSVANNAPVDEQHYLFFKRLCQLLVSLGMQLASMWGVLPDVKEPTTFQVYLSSILTFTQHPSILLNQYTTRVWTIFFQHRVISENPHVQAVISQLMPVFLKKLAKVVHTSATGQPLCPFARFDFDSEEESSRLYQKCRSHLLEILRFATKLQPQIAYQCGADAMMQQLTTPDPQVIEALSSYLDVVCGRLYLDDKLKLFPGGLDLLKKVLEFQCQDYNILSYMLSCMSSLIIFLKLDSELLPLILNKLFNSSIFSELPATEKMENESFKNFRRHSAASIVRISMDHAPLVLPAFNQMCVLVEDLISARCRLYSHEKCLLLEALVLLSNELHDFEKQEAFFRRMFAPTFELWVNLKSHATSAEDFQTFYGLKDFSVTDEEKHACRIQATHTLSIFNGIVRRCRWPKDLEIAEKGGYLVKNGAGPNGQYLRNAAASSILPQLDGIFCYLKCINFLYEPAVMSSMPKFFFEIPEGEKRIMLGLYVPEKCEETVTTDDLKMKNFVYFNYDICLQVLGNISQYMQFEFYAMANLSLVINTCVLSSLEHLPDYRLKSIFHFFLKPFFQYCPLYHHDILVSVLEVLCPFMYQKLSFKWQNFKEQYGTSVGYEDKMTEAQEILDDQLNRLLTREYVDFLYCILKSKKGVDFPSDAMEEESELKVQNNDQNGKMTELGVMLFKNELLRSALVCTCFKALQWMDTNASHKSTLLCFSIFNQLKQNSMLTTEQEASFLLESVLSALSELGEHEMNQNLLISLSMAIYESLRPSFPSLKETIWRISGSKPTELQKFDAAIFDTKLLSYKKKREIFKCIVSDVIGKNIGQYFKNDIRIKNLPRLFLQPKPKPQLLDKGNEDLAICSLFSGDSNSA